MEDGLGDAAREVRGRVTRRSHQSKVETAMWPLSCLERRCSAVSNEIVKAYAGDLCITSRSSTAYGVTNFFFAPRRRIDFR